MTASRRIAGWWPWFLLAASILVIGLAAPASRASDPPHIGRAAHDAPQPLPAAPAPGAAAAPGGPETPATPTPASTTTPTGTTAAQGVTGTVGPVTPGTPPTSTAIPPTPHVPAARKPPPPAQILGPQSPPLPPSFVGLSVETSLVASWFSSAGCHSPIQQALAMLGRPEIRVGGNSQDRLWPTAPLPPGASQVISAGYLHALHCLSATGSPLLVGLNLLGANPDATGAVLREVASVVSPKLLTLALGNEPDQYGGRLPPPGGYASYIQLYNEMRAALRVSFGAPLPQIAGPDPSTSRWISETTNFIATQPPNVADEHVYGLNGCHRTLGSPTYPSIAHLLAAGASTRPIAALAPVLDAARTAGIRAQISEANSVACGGMAGISDSPASALWGLDLVATAAQAGFSHVELHNSGGSYDPIVLAPDGSPTFRPLWTAIYLADQLWPAGTRPLRLDGELQAGLTGWAARRPDGSLALLLVNGNMTQARRLVLATPATTATLGRIVASGPQSVKLDGRQLAWSHGAPVWKGSEHLETPPIKKGRLAVTLAPQSAAWVVLGKGELPIT